MPGPRYRAAAADQVLVEPLDLFTAIFHRPSGITHLLTEPAPQILAVLAQEPLDAEELLARLARDYELGDGEGAELLAERLGELEAAGLVDRV
ncbi:HPr-rel-A system PqqD family peptide chaperone [Sphingomonas sp.]|uniref:HPr-rel-A system PqqD family peptide chaperone n=1 Tax=Sphingomonas sp. TaxID=28214 RepID=UPI0031E49364